MCREFCHCSFKGKRTCVTLQRQLHRPSGTSGKTLVTSRKVDLEFIKHNLPGWRTDGDCVGNEPHRFWWVIFIVFYRVVGGQLMLSLAAYREAFRHKPFTEQCSVINCHQLIFWVYYDCEGCKTVYVLYKCELCWVVFAGDRAAS